MAKNKTPEKKEAEISTVSIRLDKETYRSVNRKLFELNDRFAQNKQGNLSYANLCRISNEIWLRDKAFQAEVEKRFLAQ